MKTLVLSSGKGTIEYKGKKNLIFLVYDQSDYKFIERPTVKDHCVAAFCFQNNFVTAIKLHSSFLLGDNEYTMELKKDEKVCIGLDVYTLKYKIKNQALKYLSAAILVVTLVLGALSFGHKKCETQIAVARPIQEELVQQAPVVELEAQKPTIDPEQFAQGELLVQQAESDFTNGDYKFSIEKYIKAKTLFADTSEKPAYFSKIESGIKASEDKLREQFSPKLEKAKSLIQSKEAARIKEGVAITKDVLSTWGNFSEARDILKSGCQELDKLAMPHLIKADTLRQLSNCKDALIHYKQALALAAFPEVQSYERAEAGMSLCN